MLRSCVRLLIVGVCVALAGSAGADVICKRRSGILAMRDACRATETKIDFVALGAGVSPPSPLVVRDANGAFVGLVIEARPANFDFPAEGIGNVSIVRPIGDAL